MDFLANENFPHRSITILKEAGHNIVSVMKETIRARLRDVEKAEGLRILYACESGSRAWGFPSSDSDYDVRFI